MNKHAPRPGKLRNLNFLIDAYQHIPQTSNANEQYFIQENLRKHSSLRLFQLTRFRPNRWVETKPSKQVQQKQQINREDQRVQLRKKSYTSRQGYHEALEEKHLKFQDELQKLSSLGVFDEQIRSRAYSRKQKRILEAVKENAKKTIQKRTIKSSYEPIRASSKMQNTLSVEEEFDILLKGQAHTPGNSLHSSRVTLRRINTGWANSSRSKRPTLQ